MKSIKSNASQVNAILEGRKTQTRRVIKVQPENPNAIISRKSGTSYLKDVGKMSWIIQEKEFLWKGDKSKEFKIPYEIGDKIFVKEDFQEWDDGLVPMASNPKCSGLRKTKSAHYMKQEQSRITLEITDIRVERLRDISEEDAKAEGMFFTDYGNKCYHDGFQNIKTCPSKVGHENKEDGWNWRKNNKPDQCLGSARMAFANLWNSIHKNKPEKSWDANPFVWVLTFKKI
jgi:hypothetical protein